MTVPAPTWVSSRPSAADVIVPFRLLSCAASRRSGYHEFAATGVASLRMFMPLAARTRAAPVHVPCEHVPPSEMATMTLQLPRTNQNRWS
jgi:hypothetical protein